MIEDGRLRMEEKKKLAEEVNSMKGTEPLRAWMKFCAFMIDEIRLENDTVPKEQIEYQQGKIAVWHFIHKAMRDGVPMPNLPKNLVK
jgi:hypothetical protein